MKKNQPQIPPSDPQALALKSFPMVLVIEHPLGFTELHKVVAPYAYRSRLKKSIKDGRVVQIQTHCTYQESKILGLLNKRRRK